MRVLYVNQDPGIGPGRKKGAAVHVAAMQQAFRELGCEVVALEHKDEAALSSELERLRASGAVDLIYERYALGASCAGAFARSAGVPHVLEVNAPLLEEAATHRGGLDSQALHRREAQVLRAADRVFAVSNPVAEYARGLGVEPTRVSVHPNAVDATRFRPRADDRMRKSLGVPKSAFVLGFHGRLRPWHGFERVAEAARRLFDQGRNVHVLTVGEGDFTAVLASFGLSAQSTSLPWVPHESMPEHVACFDALPLGYAPDSSCYFSPLKLLEAMACGVVPVVPDLGDLPLVVGDGAAGLVYPAGSVSAMTATLELLIGDPARHAKLGQHAVRRAAERSWTAIARAALEIARTQSVR